MEVAGPEMSLEVTEYQSLLYDGSKDDSSKHHGDTAAFEKRSRKQVKAFADVLECKGNPFEEDALVTLISKTEMDEEAIKPVKIVREADVTQYQDFKEGRFYTGKISVHDPIKRNKFSLF